MPFKCEMHNLCEKMMVTTPDNSPVSIVLCSSQYTLVTIVRLDHQNHLYDRIIISILQMKTLSLRKMRWFTNCHANNVANYDSNPSLLIMNLMFIYEI